jgi:hypothetical protein
MVSIMKHVVARLTKRLKAHSGLLVCQAWLHAESGSGLEAISAITLVK